VPAGLVLDLPDWLWLRHGVVTCVGWQVQCNTLISHGKSDTP